MTEENILQRLQELRNLYKLYPDKRKTIIMQARALNIALELLEKRSPKTLLDTV